MTTALVPLRSRPWAVAFSVGLVLRVLLMAPLVSRTSDPVLFFVVGFVFHALVAAGVLLGYRIAIALGIYGAVQGLLILGVAQTLAWPSDWVAINSIYAVVLAGVGALTWREADRARRRVS